MGEGAFVEFDASAGMITTRIGPRRTALIPTVGGAPLSLQRKNARFVKVRRRWWQLWRTKPE
jgi:hypothetical protein